MCDIRTSGFGFSGRRWITRSVSMCVCLYFFSIEMLNYKLTYCVTKLWLHDNNNKERGGGIFDLFSKEEKRSRVGCSSIYDLFKVLILYFSSRSNRGPYPLTSSPTSKDDMLLITLVGTMRSSNISKLDIFCFIFEIHGYLLWICNMDMYYGYVLWILNKSQVVVL